MCYLGGGALALRSLGRNFKNKHYGPRYTIQELKRSAQWANQETKTRGKHLQTEGKKLLTDQAHTP